MEVNITKENGVVTAALIGRLDTPAAVEVAPRFDALNADASETIILDCKDLEYISSSGLRLFLTLRKTASDRGGKVIVRSINHDIRTVFMMTGFLNLFVVE
ncbi:MAG: STAS domain-containing protein [Bacteroidales bacterium]|nr:STAS domain-containing protein [Bacteroidales bacterium]